MLPLETRAELAPSAKASLLKVVSLAEFAQSPLPFERLALDLRDVPADHASNELLNLPWGAVLPSGGLRPAGEAPLVRLEGPPGVCKPGDVVELNPYLDHAGMSARLLVDLVASLFGRQIMPRQAARLTETATSIQGG